MPLFAERNNLNNTGVTCEIDLRGKRILLLFPHMVLPGGALNYMLKLVELLVKNGATVGILTMQADMQRYGSIKGAELLSINGPVTSKLGYWFFFPLWQKKITRKIHAWVPDILVPQVFPSNWWAWLYKGKNAKIPIVWVCQEPSAFIHSRNWINALQPFWKKYLARILNPLLAFIDLRLSHRTDKVIANSFFSAGVIEGIYRRKVDAIAYPAIDFNIFYPENSVPKQGALITVAKLSRFKRVDFLIRVFALVLKKYPRLTYHIVGRGEDEDSLRSLVEELHISANVQFHRNLNNDQLAALHRTAKIFLHGSIDEPFGMAPLEAISCGTPVIAHHSGGPMEFINERCGRLINSLSEESWCEVITNVLEQLENDPNYFKGVSENAQKFSWELTLAPLIKLIGNNCD